MSPAQAEITSKELKKMKDLGIVRNSKSDYASPVVLIPKPDGSWRFCVDYRKLNKHTKLDSYPLPNIQECLSKLLGAKFFAKFDLAAGYWQIAMHNGDIERTAFITPQGLFEFTVMPFGLKTAPATFQRMMDKLFSDMDKVIIYMDDLLAFGNSMEELLVNIDRVFYTLEKLI